jgi:flagellar protein FlaG
MKVDGIDPMVLNRVKDQATRSPVQEAERADTQRARTEMLREQQLKARQQAATAVATDENMLQELEGAVLKLNDTAEAMQLSLRFHMHSDSDRWMVQVVDVRQDEIIREIPPEKVLNVVAQIQSLIGILLLDERR